MHTRFLFFSLEEEGVEKTKTGNEKKKTVSGGYRPVELSWNVPYINMGNIHTGGVPIHGTSKRSVSYTSVTRVVNPYVCESRLSQ